MSTRLHFGGNGYGFLRISYGYPTVVDGIRIQVYYPPGRGSDYRYAFRVTNRWEESSDPMWNSRLWDD